MENEELYDQYKRCRERFISSVALKILYIHPEKMKLKGSRALLTCWLALLSMMDVKSSPNPRPIVNGKPAKNSESEQNKNFLSC
jgi:hypothetical protein